jgi:hypothetical protein
LLDTDSMAMGAPWPHSSTAPILKAPDGLERWRYPRRAREGGDAMSDEGFTHIRDILPGVLKEIARRAELRPRFEAELGRQLSDDEFLAIADQQRGRL